MVANCDCGTVVMTKLKEKDGITKYHVNRRVYNFRPYFICVPKLTS
jgi:hypothetical protein